MPKLQDPKPTPADASGQSETDPHPAEKEDFFSEQTIKRSAPPWLISTVFHLMLLLILALISTPAGSSLGDLMLVIGSSEGTEEDGLTEFSIDPSDTPVLASEIETESESDVDIASIFNEMNLSDTNELASIAVGIGPMVDVSTPMFNGRSGAMKRTLLALYGGTAKTQEAVELGLAWLSRNQLPNGSWSMQGPYSDGAVAENKPAATAMALLAFLGDGNTHQSGDYAKNVDKGIKWLVRQQSRSGFMAKDARGHEQAYAQAQATIVLCELYAMTKDSWLRDRAQLAIDYAEDAQGHEGGWRYYPKSDSDTSVTGWFVMALQSGISGGLDVDRNILYNVEGYLDAAQHFEGAAYGYQARSNPSAAMTAEGLLCRQYLGWPRNHPAMTEGIDALLDTNPFSIRNRDVYYWYYATQIMHHYGGKPWKQWNLRMRSELPMTQEKRGRQQGSWDPQSDEWGSSGRLYTTCLSLYCLEVYYRHMPLYADWSNEQ
ncbi:Pectic acid lyase [Planctomycetes bacterium CA13]|uniref:Pectic acid lyase n=1 Tax=Novipirellula herctigrandis TaxID=2527986 RepID=A0A5C5Z1H3_9BACT|nr:Pectic acid lyase [Planctomycetes bacterium CA13]